MVAEELPALPPQVAQEAQARGGRRTGGRQGVVAGRRQRRMARGPHPGIRLAFAFCRSGGRQAGPRQLGQDARQLTLRRNGRHLQLQQRCRAAYSA